MHELSETVRRRINAQGTPVLLADGTFWLIASPLVSFTGSTIIDLDVDKIIDGLFESAVTQHGVSYSQIKILGKRLLQANYELSESEADWLLSVSSDPERENVSTVILETTFSMESARRTYSSWIRATLLANGLSLTKIPFPDLLNVLTILIETRRTVPLSSFADICREVDESTALESLV